MRYLSDIPRDTWGDDEDKLDFLFGRYLDAHGAYWRLLDSGYFGSTKHKGTTRSKEYWSNVQSAERKLSKFSKDIGISPWNPSE